MTPIAGSQMLQQCFFVNLEQYILNHWYFLSKEMKIKQMYTIHQDLVLHDFYTCTLESAMGHLQENGSSKLLRVIRV